AAALDPDAATHRRDVGAADGKAKASASDLGGDVALEADEALKQEGRLGGRVASAGVVASDPGQRLRLRLCGASLAALAWEDAGGDFDRAARWRVFCGVGEQIENDLPHAVLIGVGGELWGNVHVQGALLLTSLARIEQPGGGKDD